MGLVSVSSSWWTRSGPGLRLAQADIGMRAVLSMASPLMLSANKWFIFIMTKSFSLWETMFRHCALGFGIRQSIHAFSKSRL